MTKQREAKLTTRIRQELQRVFPGIFVFKVWGNEHMLAGLPDLLGCWDGRFFGLEVKLPESRTNVSARQELVHGMIQKAGGVAEVVTSPAEAVAVMRHLDDPNWLSITRSVDDA